jgi:hypothetical protein
VVPGVLGVQPEAIACVNGRLNAGGVSARPPSGKKPRSRQVALLQSGWLKETDHVLSVRTRSAIPLRQTASLGTTGT